MDRTIAVLTDVKDVSDLLDGASLDQVGVKPAGGNVQLVLGLTRAMLEQQAVVRRGFTRRIKTPWTKCELQLSRVKSLTIRRASDRAPDQAPLLACDAVVGGYQLTVKAPDGLELILGMDQLDGRFADVGRPIDSP